MQRSISSYHASYLGSCVEGLILQRYRTNIPLTLNPLHLPLLPPRNLAFRASHDRTRMNDAQYYQRQ